MVRLRRRAPKERGSVLITFMVSGLMLTLAAGTLGSYTRVMEARQGNTDRTDFYRTVHNIHMLISDQCDSILLGHIPGEPLASSNAELNLLLERLNDNYGAFHLVQSEPFIPESLDPDDPLVLRQLPTGWISLHDQLEDQLSRRKLDLIIRSYEMGRILAQKFPILYEEDEAGHIETCQSARFVGASVRSFGSFEDNTYATNFTELMELTDVAMGRGDGAPGEGPGLISVIFDGEEEESEGEQEGVF